MVLMYRFCVLMLFIILTTCYIVLSFVFVLLLILLLLLDCFMWYPFNVARYLNIPSMCLYYLSFFACVFCICDFLCFFGSYNVTLYFKRSHQYDIVLLYVIMIHFYYELENTLNQKRQNYSIA